MKKKLKDRFDFRPSNPSYHIPPVPSHSQIKLFQGTKTVIVVE